MELNPRFVETTKKGKFMMFILSWSRLKSIGLMTILITLKILHEAYVSNQWMLSESKHSAIEVFSTSTCKLRWINVPERRPDGVYDLSFRYCVNPLLRVTRYTTFPLDRISQKRGGDRNITFAEMTKISDGDWKRPINPGVFLLYPQGIALRDVIKNYRETGLVSERPINNPKIKFIGVSTSVCQPKEVRDGNRLHNHDLVVIVKSAVYNFEDRRKFRNLYAHLRNQSVNLPYRIGIVFSVGLPRTARNNVFHRDGFNFSLPGRAGVALVNLGKRHAIIQSRLEQEMGQHDDLIVGNFEDTYFNLSLKMHHSFVWAARFCRGRPGFLFLDDDFAFIEKNLLATLANLPADWRRRVAISTTRWNSPTVRPSDPPFIRKWALTKQEIPWPVHAPHSNGFFSLLGHDHVTDLALAMFFTKSIPIDDVWLGLVMQRINLRFSLPPGIVYSLRPQANLSGYIGVPLHAILNAPSQEQFKYVTQPTKMNSSSRKP